MFNYHFPVIPVGVWFIGLLITVFLAIPFWFIWTQCEIGKDYFSFLPEPLQAPRFWVVVSIFICLSILNAIVFG